MTFVTVFHFSKTQFLTDNYLNLGLKYLNSTILLIKYINIHIYQLALFISSNSTVVQDDCNGLGIGLLAVLAALHTAAALWDEKDGWSYLSIVLCTSMAPLSFRAVVKKKKNPMIIT